MSEQRKFQAAPHAKYVRVVDVPDGVELRIGLIFDLGFSVYREADVSAWLPINGEAKAAIESFVQAWIEAAAPNPLTVVVTRHGGTYEAEIARTELDEQGRAIDVVTLRDALDREGLIVP